MGLLTKRSRLFLALLCIHRYLLEGAASDPDLFPIVPNPELMVEQFASANHRQSFCGEQTKFNDNGTDLKLALKGKNINTAVGLDSSFVNLDSDGTINPKDPGLMIVLLDEVARRGEFSWRESFVIEYPPIEGKSWQELLLWSIDTYDISANWWFFTSERSSLGASFPRGWYDASLSIIAKKDIDNSSSFEYFSWAMPFTPVVWIALAATMIISGIICFYLEETRIRKKADKQFVSVIISYIHASFIVFTGHLDLLPTSHPGQLVSFSLSFFALLMLSAYTANLCSFLVVQRSAFKINIESVSDVVRLGKTMCVYGSNSAAQVAVESTYTEAILVEKPNDFETFMGLQNNECDYAIVGKSGWLEYERTEATNGECNLARVGRTFKNFEAGFAVKSDAGTLCTSLVRDVINSIMYDMQEEGFVDQAWDDHLFKKQDIITPCSGIGAAAPSAETTDTLNMTNLGGIFMFHFALVAISVLGTFWTKYSCGKNKKKTNYNEEDCKDDLLETKDDLLETRVHLGSASRMLYSLRSSSPVRDLEGSNRYLSNREHRNRHGPQIDFVKGGSALDSAPIENSSSALSSNLSQSDSSDTANELEENVTDAAEERNVGVKEQIYQMERKLSEVEGRLVRKLSEVEGQFVQIMSAIREINNK